MTRLVNDKTLLMESAEAAFRQTKCHTLSKNESNDHFSTILSVLFDANNLNNENLKTDFNNAIRFSRYLDTKQIAANVSEPEKTNGFTGYVNKTRQIGCQDETFGGDECFLAKATGDETQKSEKDWQTKNTEDILYLTMPKGTSGGDTSTSANEEHKSSCSQNIYAANGGAAISHIQANENNLSRTEKSQAGIKMNTQVQFVGDFTAVVKIGDISAEITMTDNDSATIRMTMPAERAPSQENISKLENSLLFLGIRCEISIVYATRHITNLNSHKSIRHYGNNNGKAKSGIFITTVA